MNEDRLSRVIEEFSYKNLNLFFRSKCENYAEIPESLYQYDDDRFKEFQKLGEIKFDNSDKLVVTSALVSGNLSERSGKKAQYEKAKKILKELAVYDAGFFIFHDDSGSFRFSLVYGQAEGVKKSWSNFRRFTYLVSKDQTNKTFRMRVGGCNFVNLEAIKDAFSVEKVNKEFYQLISEAFYELTGEEKYNLVLPSVIDDDKKKYEEFAIRLIGRIIFCWFLKHKKSDKDISLIPNEVLSLAAVKKKEGYYHFILEPLFFEIMNKSTKDRKLDVISDANLIPFLNGGLFEPHVNDFYPGKSNFGLKISDYWFIKFFEILEQYNFTIDENSTVDADVSVDPEMLGRIFENLLAEVVPETGESARKATGSYYTPRTIVDYMVEQSLKQYLLTKTILSEDKVNSLLSFEDEAADLTSEEKKNVVKALKEIKVIDPACGSGAFPMGILHRMLLVLEKVDPGLDIWKKLYLGTYHPVMRKIIEDKLNKGNEQYIRKLTVIQDSIYGVDIQPIAVEIAKLRCFLSLVVDELVIDEDDNRGIEPLPNLEFKFVAANTLICLPPAASQSAFGVTDLINELKELREAYLNSFSEEKDQIEKKFRTTQQKLFKENVSWAVSDTLVKQLTEWDPFSYESCSWFDPGWMFGEKDFDIVIANPPYLKERDNRKIFEPVNRSSFGMKYHQGKMDFWYYFLHEAIDIVKNNGVISYITSRYWLNSSGAKKLIKRVREELSFISFIDIGKLKVFDEVAGQHMVAIYQKNKDKLDFIYKKLLNDLNDISAKYDTKNIQISTLNKNDVFSENNEIILESFIFDNSNTIPLGKITDIAQGVVEATDKVTNKQLKSVNDNKYSVGQGIFVLTKKEIENLGLNPIEQQCLKKYLDPSDVGKYFVTFSNRYLIYSDNDIRDKIENDKRYSTLKHHLDHFQCFITSSNAPYGLHRPREKRLFDNPKIIFANMFENVGFALDNADNYYFGFSFSSILQKDINYDLKYILAILNSSFAQTWFYKKGKKRGAGVDIGVEKLRLFPIKQISKTEQEPFVLLVDEICNSTSDKDYLSNPTKQAKVKKLEHQIDEMVYKLYGLAPEEKVVVEGRA